MSFWEKVYNVTKDIATEFNREKQSAYERGLELRDDSLIEAYIKAMGAYKLGYKQAIDERGLNDDLELELSLRRLEGLIK
ncbi:MAG: hypothetical protein K6G85_00430 [Eubacterium sp.]|nr:hypothetical protein [Eubacterium sp.]